VLWLGAASFFVLGIVLVLLGVLQVQMTSSLGLSLAQHGFLGALLALGAGVGLVLGGPLVDRSSRRVLFVGASGVAAATLLAVDGAMAYGRIAAHLALLGIGVGCYITLINAAVIDRYGAGVVRRLAVIHAVATAGAASGPWLIGWAQAALGGGWPGTFRLLGALYTALALLGLLWRFPEPRGSSAPQA
jgi:MFS family permease